MKKPNNDGIRDAIVLWNEEGPETPTRVFDAIIEGMRRDGQMLVPLKQINREWHFIYTDDEQVLLDDPVSVISVPIKQILQTAVDDRDIKGLVINPASKSIALPTELISVLLSEIRPMSEDEMLADEGAQAYDAQDYRKALELYTRAAQMGNITAMSNLGYCYYYGRSIPVDKEKARQCWEKAAILGDICATYKIADMYRNGDLPKDECFSRKLYIQAYENASTRRDINNYPDACLRIIKYCTEDIDHDMCVTIAKDAEIGFRARVEMGDEFARKMHREVLEWLEKNDRS